MTNELTNHKNSYYEFLSGNQNIKGIFIISHGMAEHIQRYDWLISKLNNDGYHVIGKDHRGHGINILNGDTRGFFADNDGWSLVTEDLRAVIEKSKALYPDLKHFLFAHSMGSWVALSLFNKKLDINGMIISGSSKVPKFNIYLQKLVLKIEIIRNGPKAESSLLDNLTIRTFNKSFAPNRTPNDWISSDNINVDNYTEDPLCGYKVTNSLWQDLSNGLLTIFNKKYYCKDNQNIPITILSGEFDAVSSNGLMAMKLYKFLSHLFINISFRLIDNARHEIFSDLNKDSSYDVLQDFIRKIK